MVDLTITTGAIAIASGGVTGLSLGLVGGGGSILAVPLLAHVVGVAPAHVAIGTSALAVALNAFANLLGHARQGHVKWRCAIVFALAGIAGAFVGSSIGKRVDGDLLLGLFALIMIVTGIAMLRRKANLDKADVRLTWESAPQLAPKLVAIGAAAGMLAGFFGIGGGFLIVPGLVLATGMPILYAVGSSLVAVTAFGLTTATNYAISGLIDWPIAGLFLLGGIAGGLIGGRAAKHLARDRNRLAQVFAVVIFVVAAYMMATAIGPLLG